MTQQIFYIANIRLPTEKAHGFQIMKMCEAFALNGNEVTLITPRRKNSISDDPFSYYEISKDAFLIRQIDVGTFDLYHSNKIVIAIKNAYYSFRFLVRLGREYIPEGAMVYTRNATIAAWIGLRFPEISVIYEAHGVPNHFSFHQFFLRKVSVVIAITQGIINDYRARGYSGKMIVEPDAVDLTVFAGMNDQHKLRIELGLPIDQALVVYTGSFSLYSWKGVDVLINAAAYFPENIRVVLVGGSLEETDRMKSSLSSGRFIFVPRVSRKLVAKYLCAADILILPNTKGDLASERYTSPLKLFEYMASGTPIVASDLPSIREMIDENHAFLFKPNDPVALADTVKKVLAHPGIAQKLSRQARGKVEMFTWQLRASRVIHSLF